jgi:CBS domain-containing protein
MKIKECMTRDPRTIAPDRSIKEAAQLMSELDVGMLPVEKDDRLVGVITDRDIVLRAVCKGKGLETPVSEAMSPGTKYCREDADDTDVAANMADIQLRRLPVVNKDKRLVGIVSIGDLARAKTDAKKVGEAIGGISR